MSGAGSLTGSKIEKYHLDIVLRMYGKYYVDWRAMISNVINLQQIFSGVPAVSGGCRLACDEVNRDPCVGSPRTY